MATSNFEYFSVPAVKECILCEAIKNSWHVNCGLTVWSDENFSSSRYDKNIYRINCIRDFENIYFAWVIIILNSWFFLNYCLIRKYTKYSPNLSFGWECNDTTSLIDFRIFYFRIFQFENCLLLIKIFEIFWVLHLPPPPPHPQCFASYFCYLLPHFRYFQFFWYFPFPIFQISILPIFLIFSNWISFTFPILPIFWIFSQILRSSFVSLQLCSLHLTSQLSTFFPLSPFFNFFPWDSYKFFL